ncbi:unnamed protein product, partial [Discosporangium mesarthrocarpum]
MKPCRDGGTEAGRAGRQRCNQRCWSSYAASGLVSLLLFLVGPGVGDVAVEGCPDPPPVAGSPYSRTVSTVEDIDALVLDLSNCTGGVFEVTWSGELVVTEPLVVPPEANLTITGVPEPGGAEAAMDGGGVTGLIDLSTGSSLTLDAMELRNALREWGNGGGVNAEARNSVVVAKNTKFVSNAVTGPELGNTGYGGAMSLRLGSVATLEGCVISGNSATAGGGGVYMADEGTSLTLINTAILGNSADFGGGVCGFNSTEVLAREGTEFANNTSKDWGGGLYM